jgi:cysteinyl-tRNA synthetase
MEARRGLERFYAAFQGIKDALKDVGAGTPEVSDYSGFGAEHRAVADKLSELPGRFVEAMDDDFNTSKATGHLFDAVRMVNAYVADKKIKISDEKRAVLRLADKTLREIGEVLGLFREDPDRYLMDDRNREARKRGLDVEEIDRLVAERWAARAAKDWQRADEIRNRLSEMRIELMDTPTSSTWKIE